MIFKLVAIRTYLTFDILLYWFLVKQDLWMNRFVTGNQRLTAHILKRRRRLQKGCSLRLKKLGVEVGR